MRTVTAQGNSKMKKPTHIKTALKSVSKNKTSTKASTPDYAVCFQAMNNPKVFADLARWGREEINIAEKEMPGLMALRKEFGKTQPLKGAPPFRAPAPGTESATGNQLP